MKKQLTIRLDSEILQKVVEYATQKKLFHPVAKNLPNYSKALEGIISEYEINKTENV